MIITSTDIIFASTTIPFVHPRNTHVRPFKAYIFLVSVEFKVDLSVTVCLTVTIRTNWYIRLIVSKQVKFVNVPCRSTFSHRKLRHIVSNAVLRILNRLYLLCHHIVCLGPHFPMERHLRIFSTLIHILGSYSVPVDWLNRSKLSYIPI